eukprot:1423245-Amphidinium_carterae.1
MVKSQKIMMGANSDSRAEKRKDAREDKKQEAKAHRNVTTTEGVAQKKPKNKGGFKWRSQKVAILCALGSLGALVLSIMFPLAVPPSPEDPATKDFKAIALPLIRNYVASRYEDFSHGKVLPRQMKQHVIEEGQDLNLTIVDLQADRYDVIFRNEESAIRSRCEYGKQPVSCVHAAD